MKGIQDMMKNKFSYSEIVQSYKICALNKNQFMSNEGKI